MDTQCHKPTIWDGTYMCIPTIYGHVGAGFIVGLARLDKLSGSIAEKNMEKVSKSSIRSNFHAVFFSAGYRFLAKSLLKVVIHVSAYFANSLVAAPAPPIRSATAPLDLSGSSNFRSDSCSFASELLKDSYRSWVQLGWFRKLLDIPKCLPKCLTYGIWDWWLLNMHDVSK